jgi:hypothetical protein
MGLRHAKKGSTISEAWEIIGPINIFGSLDELLALLGPVTSIFQGILSLL